MKTVIAVKIICIAALGWAGYYSLGVASSLVESGTVPDVTESATFWKPSHFVLANKMASGGFFVAESYRPPSDVVEMSSRDFTGISISAAENFVIVTRLGVHYVAKVNGLNYHMFWSPSPASNGRDLLRVVEIDDKGTIFAEYGASSLHKVSRFLGYVMYGLAITLSCTAGFVLLPLIWKLAPLFKKSVAISPC